MIIEKKSEFTDMGGRPIRCYIVTLPKTNEKYGVMTMSMMGIPSALATSWFVENMEVKSIIEPGVLKSINGKPKKMWVFSSVPHSMCEIESMLSQMEVE